MHFDVSEQEFIDIYDFAALVNSTPEMIYKKIGAGEVPENLFFLHKKAAAEWVKEVGEEFFKKLKRKRVKIEEIQDVDDIVYLDNNSLQEAFSKIGYYKLGVLAAIAGGQAREKIFQNVSSNIAAIITQEMPSAGDVDEVDAAEIEGELIDLIKNLKQQGVAAT
jgi:flagellar motor switch protein FliG